MRAHLYFYKSMSLFMTQLVCIKPERVDFGKTLLQLFMKESTWSWSQVIRTGPFCTILVQNLDYFWLFEAVRVLNTQKMRVLFLLNLKKFVKWKWPYFCILSTLTPSNSPKWSKFWTKIAQKGLVLMTWDQDQVDSFIKGYNWTNFEQKSCRMNTSTLRAA